MMYEGDVHDSDKLTSWAIDLGFDALTIRRCVAAMEAITKQHVSVWAFDKGMSPWWWMVKTAFHSLEGSRDGAIVLYDIHNKTHMAYGHGDGGLKDAIYWLLQEHNFTPPTICEKCDADIDQVHLDELDAEIETGKSSTVQQWVDDNGLNYVRTDIHAQSSADELTGNSKKENQA